MTALMIDVDICCRTYAPLHMERFYENLWKDRDGKKFSKKEALREAQL
jgi:hypothetical protein